RVHIHGTMLQNGSSSDRTLTFRIKYGASTIIGDITAAIPRNALARAFALDVWLAGNGATNAQTASAKLEYSAISNASVAGTGDLATTEFVPGQTLVGTSAVDSTAAQTFSVTTVTSAAAGTQTFTRMYAIAELVK
ncbi:MAG TPA: hypothetical protein VJ726_06275, partial [Candidatus Limnocylindria bacterium]|nr:hypothetical protein [Candidatus Limnocylindria bacterium]